MLKIFSLLLLVGLSASSTHAGKHTKNSSEDERESHSVPEKKKALKKRDIVQNRKNVEKHLENMRYLNALHRKSYKDGGSWNRMTDLSLGVIYADKGLCLPIESREGLKTFLESIVLSEDLGHIHYGQKVLSPNAVELITEYVIQNIEHANNLEENHNGLSLNFGLVHDGVREKIIGGDALDHDSKKFMHPLNFIKYVENSKNNMQKTHIIEGTEYIYPIAFGVNGEKNKRTEEKITHQINKIEL